MPIRRVSVKLTTNALGVASAYLPEITGLIDRIAYRKTDFADTTLLLVTSVTYPSGILVVNGLTASAVYYPRKGTNNPANGSVLLYAAGGKPVSDRIAVFNEAIAVSVYLGGATKTGVFEVYYEV